MRNLNHRGLSQKKPINVICFPSKHVFIQVLINSIMFSTHEGYHLCIFGPLFSSSMRGKATFKA